MTKDDVYNHLCETPIISGEILFEFQARENANSNVAELFISDRKEPNARLILTDYLITDDLELRIKMKSNGNLHLKAVIDIPVHYTIISQYLFLSLKSFQVLANDGKFSAVEY